MDFRTCLIVDDSRIIRKVARRIVEGVGFDMEQVRRIRKWVSGATTNDVFMATVGGALRNYLLLCGDRLQAGLAAAVLNHPATGVAWLVNKLAPYGEGLAAGEVVLGGSFTRPVAAAAGDTFHADYGPLGNIAFRFV